MFTSIKTKEDARGKMIKGVNLLADAVCSTLGPRGTNVIIGETSYPTITKDGVTVAQHVSPEDKFENMGVSLGRQASEKTNSVAGDGTTSTVAIFRDIINEGNKYIVAGMNPILIKKGMDDALQVALKELGKITKKLETREDKVSVATISANNDKELGEMIVDVIDGVGKDGVITVTTSNTFKTEVEYVNGMKLDSWFESSVFITDPKRLVTELKDPVIIITSERITQQNQLVPMISKLLTAGKREMVLFSEGLEGQALAFLIQNLVQWKFACIPVKLPSFGGYQKDIMRDFATLTQTNILGTEEGKKLEEWDLSDTGTCENLILSRGSTIVSGGKWDISGRIDEVKALMDGEKDSFKIEKLKERLGKLNGKVANIRVGGASEAEQSEVKYRIEDALNATKLAIEDGIVEGAGTALLRSSELINLDPVNREYDAGVAIVKKSMQAPFKKIISNGWENADAIMGKVLEWEDSYNSLSQKYENLFDAGVIDPKKVVENEIINAVSNAGVLLTSDVAIVYKDSKKE